MDFKLTDSPYRLMKLIWENEPITSMELAKIALRELGWKRTTTYSVIRRLAEQGCCVNEDTVVTSLVSPDEVERSDGTSIVEYTKKRLGGSLPKLITAFVDNKGMTKEEADEVMDILKRYYGD